jgi:predicted SAM-dependent methyltransferase
MPKSKLVLKRIAYSLLPETFIDIALLIKKYFYDKKLKNSCLIKNQAVIEALLKSNHEIQLELGSGKRNGMEGWTSIDLGGDSDIHLDLSLPLPFPDNCVAKIYSSHLLEHFFYPKPMTDLLAECYRILKPEGIFSVAVPNARIYLDAYVIPENFDYKKYCLYDVGLSFKSKIEYVNYMAYMGGHHCYMFDEENLLIILTEARFKNVKLREFDPTLDLEERRYETIYAEGIK